MNNILNKILYVEDDENIAEITQIILKDIGGFEVKHCASGYEALESVSSYAPQLILMDVMMPGIDGVETMKIIKKDLDNKNIPIVFMTAKVQTHEQTSYKNLGAIGVIIKPFEPTNLCSDINNLWEARHDYLRGF